MKFAVNYSDALVQLIKAKSVKVDLIKCPDWEGMLKEAAPFGEITVHFDLEIGLGNTFDADFSRIREIKNQTGTPHVNTHLVTPRNLDPTHQQEMDHINHLWRKELQVMIDQIGADSVALEHFPYTLATPHILPAADAKTFSQVILDTHCMFLLDLAHARITANTLEMDVKDYIRALPLDRLVEMHITGIKAHSEILTDHFEMMSEDWNLLAWALQEIRSKNWRTPEIVAFEYGGVGSTFVWRTDREVLLEQVPKLYNMVHPEGDQR